MNRKLKQRGAATLVTVMILFILIAMVAAFASRNMVFEQRIASNYYRSNVAMETAEAGAEWTMAMLNGMAIDGSCQSNTGGSNSFRQRYLKFGTGRQFTTTAATGSPAVTTTGLFVSAACVRTAANNWSCQCPSNSPLQAPAGLNAVGGLQPAFDVQLESVSSSGSSTSSIKPGILRIVVTSCTGISPSATWGGTQPFTQSCIASISAADSSSFATGGVTTDVALVSALKMPPATPLVVLGNVDAGSPSALGLHNSASSTGGLLMQIGGSLTNSLASSDSLPGAPVSDALISNDPGLQAISLGTGTNTTTLLTPSDVFFARFFGMPLNNYQTQPAMRTVQCSSDCSNTLVSNIAAGMQMMWLSGAASGPGPVTLATNVTLGSPTNPVVIVVNGDLTITGGMQIYGLLYVNGNLTWTNSSGFPGTVDGVVISAKNVAASGSVNLVYDANVVNILNNQRGSFVRVPGSWIDQNSP